MLRTAKGSSLRNSVRHRSPTNNEDITKNTYIQTEHHKHTSRVTRCTEPNLIKLPFSVVGRKSVKNYLLLVGRFLHFSLFGTPHTKLLLLRGCCCWMELIHPAELHQPHPHTYTKPTNLKEKIWSRKHLSSPCRIPRAKERKRRTIRVKGTDSNNTHNTQNSNSERRATHPRRRPRTTRARPYAPKVQTQLNANVSGLLVSQCSEVLRDLVVIVLWCLSSMRWTPETTSPTQPARLGGRFATVLVTGGWNSRGLVVGGWIIRLLFAILNESCSILDKRGLS